jgi:hypothetical protein
MDDEISVRKLSPEIIEACLDRDTAELMGRTDDEILAGDVWGEIEAFNKCVMASERIRGGLFGIVSALYDPEVNENNNTDLSVLLERFQSMLRKGQVTEYHVHLVTQACRTFFWMGWHARGAVEDQDKLRNMIGE